MIAKGSETKRQSGKIDFWPGWKKMSTVICSVCKKETKDYYFVGSKDLIPICSSCSGVKKVMESVAVVQESKLERVFNDKDQNTLQGWIK